MALVALALWPGHGRAGEQAEHPGQADVVVVGATPAGIAAATSAARSGSTVLLLEPTRHVGGIVSSGLTNADIHNRRAVAGLFHEFTRRVLKHYRGGKGDRRLLCEAPFGPFRQKAPVPFSDLKLCRNGYFFEPGVAERVFLEMLAEQGPKIRLLYRHRIKRAERDGDRVVAVVMEDLEHGGREVTFRGKVFIDATYEGDLAARAGVEYRVGREGRAEHGERLAGRWYARFGTEEPLPGSTGEPDEGIQAFCFRIYVTRDPDNFVPVEKPEGYDPRDYDHLAADVRAGRVRKVRDAIQVWPMPGGKFEINSDHCTSAEHGPSESLDLAEENWGWPEADYDQREKIYRRYRSHNQGLLWFLAHDPRVPESIQKEMRQYGLCKDEFADNGHWPWQLYVRQGRRIVGRYVFTENDGKIVAPDRTRIQPSSIAIGEFPWDSHGVHKYDPAHPGCREGYFFVRHKPIQVPYEVLLPRKIERLLVPVACSASHVGYQTLRMEPVFMALGQASGTAAHLAIAGGVELHEVPPEDLQIALAEAGAVVTHYDDLPFDHPAFAALQFLGSRGLNPGYAATPDLKLNRQWGWVKLGRILRHMNVKWSPPDDRPDQPLVAADVVAWMKQIGWAVPEKAAASLKDRQLTVADFAVLVYAAIKASR